MEIQSARREVGGPSLTIEDIVASGDKVWARMSHAISGLSFNR
jgi:hypothetical protein